MTKLKNIILIDDQYKNIFPVLNEGFANVFSDEEPYKFDTIKFSDYYKMSSLNEYNESLLKFINKITKEDKDNYCFLLDWQFIYNINGVNKSEWYGINLYKLLKENGFNKILIFSNYTDEKEFKEILLEGGICFGKPNDDIVEVDKNNKKQNEKRNKYFQHLKYLIDSLFYDDEINRYGMILGDTPVMNEIKELIEKSAKSDVSVLILGDTGTGKELTARAIHNLSSRGNNKFLAINCGGIPSDLLETELFGYTPGTFTDQIKEGKLGLLREADGGTVLLDEIGDMPLVMQAKLLRFLQDHKVRPVGSSEEYSVDVRIICSTNKNLSKMMEEYEKSFGKNGFRSDLYWRIKVFQIILPSLRERLNFSQEMTYILFFHFIRNAFKRNKIFRIADLYLSDEAYNLLNKYEWKGNFREFENVILSATAMLEENENTIESQQVKNFLINNYIDKLKTFDYINLLKNGGSLIDIPKNLQHAVLKEYLEFQKQKGFKLKTIDLIPIVLNEKVEIDKIKIKKQSARVTQYLNRTNIKLKS
jgi:transcriptional regulator with PAS, ATPase and Fis domain